MSCQSLLTRFPVEKYLIIILFTMSGCNPMSNKLPVDYVDPNLGSYHARWFFYTPAAVPFGMAKMAPHTNASGSPGGWLPCGYSDSHNSIEGFGHFHEFQVGGLVIMPTTGKLKTVPGSLEKPDEGYRSRFEKEDEHAEAGYYSVFLKDYAIKAELTATVRTGFHRYTFPASPESHLIVDIGHRQGESGEVTEAMARYDTNNYIEGYIYTYPEYARFCDPGKNVKMYFFVRLNKKPDSVGSFVNDSIILGQIQTRGVNNGLYLTFATDSGELVELQVGLSYTSIENAKNNLEIETESMTFDKVKQVSREHWNKMLSRILVTGGKKTDKTKFYTGLYHALLGRGISSDINGQYPKNNGGIGQLPLDAKGIPVRNHYNTDGIWGGCWNLGPLWALAYPEYYSSYIQSNIDFYSETGWLHDGEAAGVYTNGVQTNFMGLMMAAAYNCGIRDFDVKTGYEAALKNELTFEGRNLGNGKYDLEYFIKQGYIPNYEYKLPNGWVFIFGASHTLEYCFNSYAVGQFAKALGKTDDYELLTKLAGNYQLLYNPETRFMQPREKDGSFIKDFDEMIAWKGFQEGNAFQYTWYVPHDVQGLIDLLGLDLFNQRLEMMFSASQKTGFGGGKEIHSFSGVEKLYNHGNQPCLHNSWLFNYSGKPWLTQKWTRNICNEFYGTKPIDGYGYGQDEDEGQIGAWYVLASMGLFDVQGHTAERPTFQLSSPLFDKIEIKLDRNYYVRKKIVIEIKNNSPENYYIQSAELNGRKLENCWFYRDELMEEGKLVLQMGPQPNKLWGIKQAPPSMSKNNQQDVRQ
jgi:predicted alpha-1,2-mannosidase